MPIKQKTDEKVLGYFTVTESLYNLGKTWRRKAKRRV